jgi:hypothetical protein
MGRTDSDVGAHDGRLEGACEPGGTNADRRREPQVLDPVPDPKRVSRVSTALLSEPDALGIGRVTSGRS